MIETKHSVWLGLGGNVGDVKHHMQSAMSHLDSMLDIEVVSASPIYRTPPWGKTDQNWFLNACVRIETTLSPDRLLAVLLETERSLNRVRDERWGPRTIDMDILLYGDLAIETENVTIPHPRMHQRAFVLKPLLDIVGPTEVAGKSLSEWLETLDDSEIELHSTKDWFPISAKKP